MKKKTDVFLLLALGIISFFVTMLFALYGVDSHHDGIMLKTAMDVANGKALYRESFYQYGYLVALIQAVFVKIFGEYLWAVHLSTVVMYTISYCVIFLIAKRYMNRICAFFICLSILAVGPFYTWDFLPWSNVFGLCFLICCLYSTLLLIETKKKIYISFMAIWAAFAFWSKLPIGAVVYLALFLLFVIFLVSKRYMHVWKKYISLFLISTMIVFAVFLIILFCQGALRDWWIQTMSFAVDFAVQRSVSPSAPVSGGETVSGLMIFMEKTYSFLQTVLGDLFSYSYSPIECMVAISNLVFFAVYLRRVIIQIVAKSKINQIDMELLCFSMFALASWSQYYPVVCIRHIFWGQFPMIALMGVGIYRMFSKLSNKEGFLVGSFTIIVVLFVQLPIIRENVVNGYSKLTAPVYYVTDSHYHYLDGIRMDQEEVLFYSDAETILYDLQQRYPEKKLLNVSQLNLFSCYSDVNLGVLYSLYGAGVYAYVEEWNRYIEENRPIIIYDKRDEAINLDEYRLFHLIEGDRGFEVLDGDVGIYLHKSDG